MEKTVEKKKTTKREPVITYLIVTVELLNVRKQPSLEAPIINTLVKGAKLVLEGDLENDFYPVTLDNGEHGFIKKDFAIVVKE